MKDIPIKKYIFYSFFFVMIFFNIIILVRGIYHFFPNMCMLGENTDNLGFYSFWADILCSIGSFTMVFITAKTIDLNERQLVELKRQWKEEHSPYLSCQLIAKSDHFLLRILNSGNTTANKVNISIDSELREPKSFDKVLVPFRFKELKEFLETQEFVIPPHESLYFTIWITPYPEVENLPSGYISVSIKDTSKDFSVFQLYPRNFAFTSFEKENTGTSIVNAISEVNRTIKNKTFSFK